MNDYVIDASAAVGALGDKGAIGIALRSRLAQATCHAPHLIDAEVGHVLRRSARRGEVAEATALTALKAMKKLIHERYPHTGRIADGAWELRHVMSFYDGLYVALAVMLDLPLLTADARLTKAPGLPCRFELIS